MKPLDALHLQMRLEGLEVVHGNRLRQVEIVPGEEMPLVLIAHLAGRQSMAYYDNSLPPELHKGLMAQAEAIEFPRLDPLLDLLRDQNFSFDVGHYKTYLFPEHIAISLEEDAVCFSKSDRRVTAFGLDVFVEQVYGIERDGNLVSACVSTRENEQCGEAWVYTDPQYRQQGLARQVVSAWARNTRAGGKVPFYSHKIENAASAGLAKRLRLLPVFEEMVVSYANQ